MDYAKEALRLHREWKGKLEVTPKVPVATREDLSLAYTARRGRALPGDPEGRGPEL